MLKKIILWLLLSVYRKQDFYFLFRKFYSWHLFTPPKRKERKKSLQKEKSEEGKKNTRMLNMRKAVKETFKLC